MTLTLKTPVGFGRQPVQDRLRWLVALGERLRREHNAEGKSLALADFRKRQREHWLPRIHAAASAIAELRDKLPVSPASLDEDGLPTVPRYDRVAVRADLRATEIDGLAVEKHFAGTVAVEELPDPTEDFTGYTEVDGDNEVTVAAALLTVTNHVCDATDYYVYYDYGAGHFGNVTHLFEFKAVNKGSGIDKSLYGGAWSLTNTLEDQAYWYTNSSQAVGGNVAWIKTLAVWRYYLWDFENAATDSDYCAITINTQYYATATRSGTSCTVDVYSDSGRTALVDTVAVTVTSGRTFRYVCGVVSWAASGGSTNTISYTMGGLDLQEAVTYTGSGAAAATAATTAGTGAYTVPVYAGSGAGSAPAASTAGTGTYAVPVYAGSGSAAAAPVTTSGTGAYTAPVYAGSGSAEAAPATTAGTGAYVVPVYQATGAAEAAPVTTSGTGAYVAPVYSGSGAASAAPAETSGAGTYTPTYAGQGSAEASPVVTDGDATYTVPTYAGSGGAIAVAATTSGVGTCTAPTYTGTGTATASRATCSGVGSFYYPGPWIVAAADVFSSGALAGQAFQNQRESEVYSAGVRAGQAHTAGGVAGQIGVGEVVGQASE